jgi:hypothetical protein
VPRSDAFAFKQSGLNAFLFAEVGTELNGSALTILSVLARLGQDPWAEAARWAKMPKAAIIDCLAQSIGQMPLCPQALTDARMTASRLILLLPSQAPASEPRYSRLSMLASLPRWAPAAIVFGALALGILVNSMMTPTATQMPAPIGQTLGHVP